MSLLDPGCTQCLVNPGVVEKLGMQLGELKRPIAFTQLAGSVARGELATFLTKPVEMRVGAHVETIQLIVTPGMTETLILGLV